MKRTHKLFGVLISLAVLITLVTTAALATNVGGIYYASNFVDGDDLVLIEDTTIFVNADVTLKSIKGDYALEIQSDGEHTLTVDNPNGSAIYVKTLKSVKPSQGTVNLTVKSGGGYFAIATTGDISLAGIKLDVNGSAGIRSAEGNVTINGTSVSVVGNDGIGVVANSGSIDIDSDYLFVQCAGQSDAWWEHGIGAVKDVTITSDDATIAGLYGIYSDTGNITLNGNIAVGGQKSAVIADNGTITMTGAVTAQSGEGYFAIAAKGDISFDGTKLDAKGSSGIRSTDGNVTINGTNVSVVGNDGVGVIANSGSIYIESDYLFVQCAGQSGDAMWEHGIGAVKDITIISDDATIAGRYGVRSDTGDISLTGTFWVGARNSAIFAKAGNITVNGDLTANNTDGYFYCVVSGEGNITLSNGTFHITSASNAVITHNGSIYLNGDITVSSSETDSCAINAREGDIIIQGGSLDVTTGGTYALGAANGNIQITQPLQILVPQNGRVDTNNLVNGSVIVDANGDPASHVRIGQFINDVSLYINAPAGGEKPASTANDVYGLSSNCSVKSITWYENDVKFNGSTFSAGKSYKVVIVLSAKDGYVFQDDEMGKINGKSVSTGWDNDSKELILTHTFGICPAAVRQVALFVNTPVEGENISASKYNATDEDVAFYLHTMQWQVSTDGGMTYTDVADGEKFVGGNYYRFFVDVQTNSGYVFALDGNNAPAVTATVNGNPATVSKAWEQEPSKVITVCYHVGMCNERLIKTVEIVNLEAPYPGKTPDYTATTYGTAYSLENSTAKDYMTDKLYKSNGIVWYDENGDYLLYDQPFEAGKSYRVKIYLDITDTENFEFDWDDDTGLTNVTGTINGNPATVTAEAVNAFWNHYIEYTFQWQPITVTEINITGLDAPVAGEHPDFDVELGDDLAAQVSYLYWYDSEGNMLGTEDVFAAGEEYQLEIKLVPVIRDQVVISKFDAAALKAGTTLNGSTPDSVAASSSNGGVVYVFHTYRAEAAAPSGANVVGFVQADFGDVKPSAALYSTDDTEHTNPLYTAEIGSAVKNGDRFEWSFAVTDVPAGTYDLVIIKDGHQDSVQRITVGNGNKHMGVIPLQAFASFSRDGDTCTVTLEVFEEGVSVLAVSYDEYGRMVAVEYLTVEDPTAILTGDSVKVFFLDEITYIPIRKEMGSQSGG